MCTKALNGHIIECSVHGIHVAKKPCKIGEYERKWEVSIIISQIFKITFGPLEVCPQAHKLQLCTL